MGSPRRRAVRLSFQGAVWRLVRRIPAGRVASYGQVAALCGRPRAARGVGRALAACPADVPWHRVVNARGGLSPRGQAGSVLTQRLRLGQEGVRLARGRVDLGHHRWAGPRGRRG